MQVAEEAREQGRPPRLNDLAQLIVSEAQALTGARTFLILMGRENETCLTALAGDDLPEGWPSGKERWSQPRAPFRLRAPSPHLDRWTRCLGAPATQMLGVPVATGDGREGVMVACDRVIGDDPFTAEDEWLLQSFASFAGLALGSCEASERAIAFSLRTTASAREDERGKWARELHDETLQNLAVVQALLSSALTHDVRLDPESVIRAASDRIKGEIGSLRHLITELRPAALDRFGLVKAIHTLVEEIEQEYGVKVDLQSGATAIARGARLVPELELTAYRIVQEALRNVVRHAGASVVYLRLAEIDELLLIVVRDDGHGFLVGERAAGVGLLGMRERAASVGGSWSVTTDRVGTEIRAVLPLAFTGES